MKKADISLTTIIVAALALIVLVVLVAIFTGKINLFSEGYTSTAEGASKNVCSALGFSCRLKDAQGQDTCGDIEFPPSGGWVDCSSFEDCCRS